MPLENRKTALITGGTRGIGKAIALELAQNKIDVIVCGKNQEHVNTAIKEIENSGGNATGYCVDATKPDDVKKVFSHIASDNGGLDVLINNVGGIEKYGGILELSEDDWKNAYDLNFMSMVYFTKESIPFLKKSNAPRIINISTVAARQPGFYNPHYSAAKSAMLNLSKHLANVLAKDKILVNSICLSTIKTEGWTKNVQNKMEQLKINFEEAEKIYQKEEEEKNPLHQIGMPEDIAGMVAFLASEKAKWITGACFTVDGGTTRSLL